MILTGMILRCPVHFTCPHCGEDTVVDIPEHPVGSYRFPGPAELECPECEAILRHPVYDSDESGVSASFPDLESDGPDRMEVD